MGQSYQEVSEIILEELKKIDIKGTNLHIYFNKLRLKDPDKYSALLFNTNGHEPFSERLEELLFDLRVSGKILFN